MKLLIELLETLEGAKPRFRPTEIYNEGWLLKILLNEYSKHPNIDSPLRFYQDADWYSEAMLPTRFKARYRGDKQAESRTNADGVIGHFKIGEKGKADLELKNGAKQFTVIEAKINSPLSKGTTKAPKYNQAARNVACMIELLNRSELYYESMEHVSFAVIAPEDEIDSGKFSEFMDRDNIKEKVKNRAYSYAKAKDKTDSDLYIEWYEKYFSCVIDSIDLIEVSWESEIAKLPDANPVKEFYKKCKDFN